MRTFRILRNVQFAQEKQFLSIFFILHGAVIKSTNSEFENIIRFRLIQNQIQGFDVMLFLSYILHELDPHIVFTSFDETQKICPQRLDFAEDQHTLTSDRAWILSAGQMEDLSADIDIETGTIIFISECQSKSGFTDEHPDAAFICVSCSTAALYNIINNTLCKLRQWSEKYVTAADQSLYATINLTAELSSAAVVLLNPNYRVVVSSGLEGSTFLAEQLTASGALPAQLAADLFGKDDRSSLPVRYSIPDSRYSLYGMRLFHEQNLISVLVMEAETNRTDIDFYGLCTCAGQALYRHIIPPNSLHLGTYTKKFRELWLEIMTEQLTQSFEIHHELEQLPFPIRTFVRAIVVEFQNKNAGGTPYSLILAELREVFPECNITVYENDIVILQTYADRCFELNLNTKELFAILERHNGFAGISNGTRDYGFLRSLYLLAQNTIVLASELRKNPKDRIFFHEEYWVYTAIDMCAHRFYDIHHHDDIVYLIHPAVIHLTRYDKQHNTNLRDTLFHYLLNDRNLVKTASVTFSHRNTVINKINKINKLICLDLDDGVLRQRLIFSCQVIRYYEDYAKKQLKI